MRFHRFAVLSVGLAALLGCSDATKQETKEALDATGEAVQAAAADAKVNAEKVGEAVKAGVERGREEFNEPDAPGVDGEAAPAAAPADDATP